MKRLTVFNCFWKQIYYEQYSLLILIFFICKKYFICFRYFFFFFSFFFLRLFTKFKFIQNILIYMLKLFHKVNFFPKIFNKLMIIFIFLIYKFCKFCILLSWEQIFSYCFNLILIIHLEQINIFQEVILLLFIQY